MLLIKLRDFVLHYVPRNEPLVLLVRRCTPILLSKIVLAAPNILDHRSMSILLFLLFLLESLLTLLSLLVHLILISWLRTLGSDSRHADYLIRGDWLHFDLLLCWLDADYVVCFVSYYNWGLSDRTIRRCLLRK